MTSQAVARYAPEFFELPTIEEAKEAILSASGEMTTEHRWQAETKWLMEHIEFEDKKGLIIDYGCGIGRLAREIKNPVLGVDKSVSMRRYAMDYVSRPTDFCAVSPEMFQEMVLAGLSVYGIISIWVLQHIPEVKSIVPLLMRALCPGGIFWELDLDRRCIPITTAGYKEYLCVNDGVQLHPLIEEYCDLEEEIPVDMQPPLAPQHACSLRKFRRRGI